MEVRLILSFLACSTMFFKLTAYFSIAEVAMVILCGCLPIMPKFFQFLLGRTQKVAYVDSDSRHKNDILVSHELSLKYSNS